MGEDGLLAGYSVSLPAHSALVLWAQVALLLAVARLLGTLARRLNLPDIAGSLTAGVLLGPAVLGQAFSSAEHWLLPAGDPAQLRLLGAVTEFSLIVMLVALGAEADLGLLRRNGRATFLVSAGSIIVPLAAGVGVVLALARLLAPRSSPVAAALVIGGALAVSSLPVIARIVTELGVERRDVGQLAISVATFNDVFGFLLLVPLSVLSGSTGVTSALLPVAGLLVLAVALFGAGQPLVDWLLKRARSAGPNQAGSLAVSVTFGIGAAAVAQALRVDLALGAFLAGIVLSRSRFQQGAALQTLKDVTSAVFAPLFFASAGLQVDPAALHGAPVVAALAVTLVVAAASKYAGSFLGAMAARLPRTEARALGIALNGRGTMQVIIGTFALRAGLISEQGFTVLLIISVVTSIALAPLLRRAVGGWEGTAQERERLAHEARLAENVIVKGQRLLLAEWGGKDAEAAALVLDRAWPKQSELTVLSLSAGGTDHGPGASRAGAARATGSPAPDAGGTRIEGLLSRPVRRRRLPATRADEAILAESHLGYGVIGIGDGGSSARSAHVTALLNRSPLPLVLVRRARDGVPTGEFSRIVVPVNGTSASRAAQEVAQALAQHNDADLHLMHAVTGPSVPPESSTAADAVLLAAQGLAQQHGLVPWLVRRRGASSGREIVSYAGLAGADAVVMGARVRRVGGRPFLGHSVEHVLEHSANITVIVVVLPDPGHTGLS